MARIEGGRGCLKDGRAQLIVPTLYLPLRGSLARDCLIVSLNTLLMSETGLPQEVEAVLSESLKQCHLQTRSVNDLATYDIINNHKTSTLNVAVRLSTECLWKHK